MENKQKSAEELKGCEKIPSFEEMFRWPPEIKWSKKKLVTILAGAFLATWFGYFTLAGYTVGKHFLNEGYTPNKIERELEYEALPGGKTLSRPGRELAYLLHYERAK